MSKFTTPALIFIGVFALVFLSALIGQQQVRAQRTAEAPPKATLTRLASIDRGLTGPPFQIYRLNDGGSCRYIIVCVGTGTCAISE